MARRSFLPFLVLILAGAGGLAVLSHAQRDFGLARRDPLGT